MIRNNYKINLVFLKKDTTILEGNHKTKKMDTTMIIYILEYS